MLSVTLYHWIFQVKTNRHFPVLSAFNNFSDLYFNDWNTVLIDLLMSEINPILLLQRPHSSLDEVIYDLFIDSTMLRDLLTQNIYKYNIMCVCVYIYTLNVYTHTYNVCLCIYIYMHVYIYIQGLFPSPLRINLTKTMKICLNLCSTRGRRG